MKKDITFKINTMVKDFVNGVAEYGGDTELGYKRVRNDTAKLVLDYIQENQIDLPAGLSSDQLANTISLWKVRMALYSMDEPRNKLLRVGRDVPISTVIDDTIELHRYLTGLEQSTQKFAQVIEYAAMHRNMTWLQSGSADEIFKNELFRILLRVEFFPLKLYYVDVLSYYLDYTLLLEQGMIMYPDQISSLSGHIQLNRLWRNHITRQAELHGITTSMLSN